MWLAECAVGPMEAAHRCTMLDIVSINSHCGLTSTQKQGKAVGPILSSSSTSLLVPTIDGTNATIGVYWDSMLFIGAAGVAVSLSVRVNDCQ